ncbi:unnamed protein product [Nippostrongylus brasiliensis]|uniref:MI domain-containing protein n=1 Tax=Nippostrongylus brasiliensis TaxID=27835 RepID=A0A0N4YQT4_NIPBR|nr:unnamed protein product [Nippostrongylus brasiliensis]
MGLKKWMSVVKAEQNGSGSRKQDRKKAKMLRKLQSVAVARHQPIEKVMEEAFSTNKKKTKKQKKKLREMESAKYEVVKDDDEDEEPKSKRRRKRDRESSESDSDEDLTYEQYLKEVKDKKRQIAIDDDAAKQDDIDIHKYSKLLGIKEGKKGKKPKSFVYDGLDDLLEFCDSDNRKQLMAGTTDQEMALKGDDLSEEEQEKNEEEEQEDVEMDDEAGSSGEDMALDEGDDENLDEDELSGGEEVGSGEDNDEKNNMDSGEESDYKEDIYGRKISKKTGKVVSFDLTGAQKKLEDLDAKGGTDESRMKVDRVLMGTLNRLSESTLVRSHQVVSEVWLNNSKNDVKSCLTRILSRLIRAPYRLQDQLLSLYALFFAQIHAFTSEEISAYFVEAFLREFVEAISQPQTQDDKKLENTAIFVAHLMNFHVIKGTVVLEVLEKLREHLNVDNLQLCITLATYSYKMLRRLHWSAFSEELSKLSNTLESAVFSALPRAKFLGETLLSMQKTAPTSIDASVLEHHLKLFHGLKKKSKLVSDKELGMSLDDLLHADERGRWWVVGSAYRVVREGGAAGGSTQASQSTTYFPEDILQLARKAKMNTDVRRNIFCTVATSDDEDSAFERLLRLSLKGQQEREIIYVLIMMLLKEKNFNPFYPALMARFCEFDKRFTGWIPVL